MKYFILFSVLYGSCALKANCQDLRTWTEELAALQTLQHTVQQGYRTMTNGLSSIGNFKDDEYQQHRTYYQSLSTVNKNLMYDQANASTSTAGHHDNRSPLPEYHPTNGTVGLRRPKVGLDQIHLTGNVPGL